MKAKPLIAWMGGKRRLVKHILPTFPAHECYVEPFSGGAALFFAKKPSPSEVINDINGDLINLYRVAKYHAHALIDALNTELVSREVFLQKLSTPPEVLTDIQRAARYYYIKKTQFGAKESSASYGYDTKRESKFNVNTLNEHLLAAQQRLAHVNIERLDWQDCMRRYDRPHTLFYCDPPYYNTAGYGVPFELEQYEALAKIASTAKGKVIISINDTPEMRDVFKACRVKELEITYTICVNKVDAPKSKELLLFNF